MSNNLGHDLPRRQLLGLLGAGSVGLAGCSGYGDSGGDGDDEEGTGQDPTATESSRDHGSTPTQRENGSDDEPYQPNPSITLPDSQLVQVDEDLYIAAGSSLEPNCDLNLEALAETHLEVQEPNGESEAQCGEPYIFEDPGEYVFVLRAESEAGNTGQDSYSVEAVIPPSISIQEAPDSLNVREPNQIQYNLTGSNVSASHQIENVQASGEYSGGNITVIPEEAGTVTIESTAENVIGSESIEADIPAELEVDVGKNQEKRREVASLVSDDPGWFIWYDTGLLSKMDPERAERSGIRPELEWYFYSKYPQGNYDALANLEVRKFDEIREDDEIGDVVDVDAITYDYSDYDRIEDYKGRPVWAHGTSQETGLGRVALDHENDLFIRGRNPSHEHLIDVLSGDYNMDSWLNTYWHKEDTLGDVPVIGESTEHYHMFTEEAEHERANTRAQVLNPGSETVKDKVFRHSDVPGRKKAELKDEEQVSLDRVINDIRLSIDTSIFPQPQK